MKSEFKIIPIYHHTLYHGNSWQIRCVLYKTGAGSSCGSQSEIPAIWLCATNPVSNDRIVENRFLKKTKKKLRVGRRHWVKQKKGETRVDKVAWKKKTQISGPDGEHLGTDATILNICRLSQLVRLLS